MVDLPPPSALWLCTCKTAPIFDEIIVKFCPRLKILKKKCSVGSPDHISVNSLVVTESQKQTNRVQKVNMSCKCLACLTCSFVYKEQNIIDIQNTDSITMQCNSYFRSRANETKMNDKSLADEVSRSKGYQFHALVFAVSFSAEVPLLTVSML